MNAIRDAFRKLWNALFEEIFTLMEISRNKRENEKRAERLTSEKHR